MPKNNGQAFRSRGDADIIRASLAASSILIHATLLDRSTAHLDCSMSPLYRYIPGSSRGAVDRSRIAVNRSRGAVDLY